MKKISIVQSSKIAVAKPDLILNFAKENGIDTNSVAGTTKAAQAWAKAAFTDNAEQRTVIKNKSFGKAIEISRRSIKDTTSHAHKPVRHKLYSMSVLDRIIANAKYVGEVPDKRNRKDVKVHLFSAFLIVEGFLYSVTLIVFETGKTYVYDHILLTNELKLCVGK